ncbi:hypothetical protein GGQ85_002104 [Nitrobacter vulgaris]|uniref:hypothetical protein n=1 Tax=Nitrobacter vulgaris TaxID=29421 RepID=UPI002856F20B|nr:hypothetical protein [Nitrobacter vulgaris]MDR6304397.1 hypothetical protein [Nitrobacter vulgaris]
MPISEASSAPRVCGEPMGDADSSKWMPNQNIGRYRAIADECYARAEHARYVLDKEAWLKLAADWNALAEDAAQRRDDG